MLCNCTYILILRTFIISYTAHASLNNTCIITQHCLGEIPGYDPGLCITGGSITVARAIMLRTSVQEAHGSNLEGDTEFPE
jgi:hypothetical protein